jgi:hypothetical protein
MNQNFKKRFRRHQVSSQQHQEHRQEQQQRQDDGLWQDKEADIHLGAQSIQLFTRPRRLFG